MKSAEEILMASRPATHPELVKSAYDNAVDYQNALIAQSEDWPTRNRFERKLKRNFRKEGQAIVENTLKGAKEFAKANSSELHEQARTEMTEELAKRDELEGFANTLDDIKNLPETNEHS